MPLHAIENLDDAAEATKALLLPFDIGRWLKLAVVVFFLGAGMSWSTPGFNVSGTSEQLPQTALPTTVPGEFFLFVGVLIVAAVILGLLWALISAIMEFVFIQSLRTETVRLRSFWRRRWRQGVRLFAFRIAIGIPVLVVVVGWLALVFGPLFFEAVSPAVPIGVFLLGLPMMFAVGLVFAIVHGFTTVFVVPIMILDECSVIAGWRRLWPSLTRDWKQYLVYAVVSVILAFLFGVVLSIVLGVAAIVLAIPLLVIGFALYLSISLTSTVGIVIGTTLVGSFLLVLATLWAMLRVPVLGYLRYYALLVLGDIDESLDLIPDRRAEIRT